MASSVSPVADSENSEPSPAPGFDNLGLCDELVETLANLGYEQPTPIQAEAIPHLLDGVDMLGQAATGTGKTAAFSLPVLDQIGSGAKAVPTALVVVPTRELAMQVSEAMRDYGKALGIKVAPVYGGQPIYQQLKALSRGVHVVVGTPGRIIDHIKRGSLELDRIATVVLDEADEMLDMGFTEDIETILENTPDERQTVLFSATMPPRINAIAKRHQTDPVRIQIKRDPNDDNRALIEQRVYIIKRHQKAAALGRILDVESPVSTIVFCGTRIEVDKLTETMNSRGYRAEALHGGMDQQQRDRVMGRLREGTADLLVATDVAARGLDVDTLTHVVNYDVPSAPESYVHRIGRVGRAGRTGVAITLADPRQRRLLGNIERLTKQKFSFSTVPSVADLRARQAEKTVELIREALAADDLDDFNPVLHGLAGVDSDRNIALAAIKIATEARGAANNPGDDVEIADASERFAEDRGGHHRDKGRGKGRFDKNKRGNKTNGNAKFTSKDSGFVYVSLGRKSGIRPGDLVGAIANETGLTGNQIGPIRISDRFAVVGVPDDAVDSVIKTLNQTTIKGKKAKTRRYVD